MHGYRCYFLDASGRIQRVEEIGAPGDEAAKARAATIYAEKHNGFPAFELFERGRLVLTHWGAKP
jgi:hypothetical protein